MNSYFEPSGLKGGFTILVAGFENDLESVADRLAKEISHRYGLHVIRTCMVVTENWEDRSSVVRLLSGYNSDLILWGKVGQAAQVELQVRRRHRESDKNMPITLTQVAIPEFVEKQLQSHLIRAIDDSSIDNYESAPPANLAGRADRIEAFVQSVDWSMVWNDDLSESVTEYDRLIDKIRMHNAVGRLMLVAAHASNDGLRVKKAIEYFERASLMVDRSGGFQELNLIVKRDEGYMAALLTDAQLNKAEDSAKAAAEMYLKEYEKAAEMRYPNLTLQRHAANAASAASELYSITHRPNDASSANRLACESLILLRDWREGMERPEKHSASLARQGLQEGIPLEWVAPKQVPEQTKAYEFLVSSGKDPSIIFAPGPEMKLADCKTF